MDAPMSAPAKTTANQPQGAVQMSKCHVIRHAMVVLTVPFVGIMNAPPAKNPQGECLNKKASRIRGGGAGKVMSKLIFMIIAHKLLRRTVFLD